MQPTKIEQKFLAEYGDFLRQLKDSIREHQYLALQAVNKQLLELYWKIGEAICKKQQEFSWGRSVVENLALDLQNEFPGQNGFSAQNLWLMRQFYNEYKALPKLQPLVREISWSKNMVILGRCKDILQREFYLRAVAKYGWTKAVLQHQIDNRSFEKFLLNQTNYETTLPENIKKQAHFAIKDHYTFDFLELSAAHSERQLEQALIKHLRQFLTEMGGHFAFIGNQYRIVVSEKEYFIDLLLFHRGLRCLVAVELKIGDFMPEHKGKMEFYLEALEKQERLPEENSPIGIIICRGKNKTVVEYSLRSATRSLGVATYSIGAKSNERILEQLPSPEQISERINAWAKLNEDE